MHPTAEGGEIAAGDEEPQHGDDDDRGDDRADAAIGEPGRRRAGRLGVALLILDLFRRFEPSPLRQSRAFGHDAGSARDRVGEVEILNARAEGRLVDRADDRGEADQRRRVGRDDHIEPDEIGMGGSERRAQLVNEL